MIVDPEALLSWLGLTAHLRLEEVAVTRKSRDAFQTWASVCYFITKGKSQRLNRSIRESRTKNRMIHSYAGSPSVNWAVIVYSAIVYQMTMVNERVLMDYERKLMRWINH